MMRFGDKPKEGSSYEETSAGEGDEKEEMGGKLYDVASMRAAKALVAALGVDASKAPAVNKALRDLMRVHHEEMG